MKAANATLFDAAAELPQTPARQFRAYPTYRDSGVPWLGKVPGGWELSPFKRYGYFKAGAGFPDNEQGRRDEELPFYKVGDMAVDANAREMREHQHSVSRDTARRLGANVFPPGTVIFAKVGAALLLNRRRILTRPSCIDNNTMGFVVEHGNIDFFYYCLSEIDFGRLANPGAVPSLNDRQLRDLVVATPPLAEQRAIAAFLDRETAKIDSLVAKKRRLIELLREKRTALISRAVTKGLNPAAPMKPSGIDWLGDVPEHWEVKRLKTLFDNLNSQRIPLSAEERGGMAKVYPYYGASGIIDHVQDFLFDEPLILVAEDGANLLSRSTPLAFIASGQYWVNNHAHILRAKAGPLVYWEAALQLAPLEPLVSGSAQPKLTKENLGTLRLPVPPAAEQEKIAAVIEGITQRYGQISDSIQKAVTCLEEYRSALISAAVTGKIDVRGEVGS